MMRGKPNLETSVLSAQKLISGYNMLITRGAGNLPENLISDLATTQTTLSALSETRLEPAYLGVVATTQSERQLIAAERVSRSLIMFETFTHYARQIQNVIYGRGGASLLKIWREQQLKAIDLYAQGQVEITAVSYRYEKDDRTGESHMCSDDIQEVLAFIRAEISKDPRHRAGKRFLWIDAVGSRCSQVSWHLGGVLPYFAFPTLFTRSARDHADTRFWLQSEKLLGELHRRKRAAGVAETPVSELILWLHAGLANRPELGLAVGTADEAIRQLDVNRQAFLVARMDMRIFLDAVEKERIATPSNTDSAPRRHCVVYGGTDGEAQHMTGEAVLDAAATTWIVERRNLTARRVRVVDGRVRARRYAVTKLEVGDRMVGSVANGVEERLTQAQETCVKRILRAKEARNYWNEIGPHVATAHGEGNDVSELAVSLRELAEERDLKEIFIAEAGVTIWS